MPRRRGAHAVRRALRAAHTPDVCPVRCSTSHSSCRGRSKWPDPRARAAAPAQVVMRGTCGTWGGPTCQQRRQHARCGLFHAVVAVSARLILNPQETRFGSQVGPLHGRQAVRHHVVGLPVRRQRPVVHHLQPRSVGPEQRTPAAPERRTSAAGCRPRSRSLRMSM
jgi:hypothetical protein